MRDLTMQLSRSNINNLPSQKWSELGDNYRLGQNGMPCLSEQAKACYENALRIDPKHANALYGLYLIYQKEADILSLDPLVRLVQRLYVNKKKLQEKNKIAMNYLIEAEKNGHEEAALKIIMASEKSADMDDAETWVRLGRTYQSSNHVLRATVCFKEAIKLKPSHYIANKQLLILLQNNLKSAQAWYLLGESYRLGLNHYPQKIVIAHACYELAKQIDPHHDLASYRLGRLYELGIVVSQNCDVARKMYADGLKNHGHYSKTALQRFQVEDKGNDMAPISIVDQQYTQCNESSLPLRKLVISYIQDDEWEKLQHLFSVRTLDENGNGNVIAGDDVFMSNLYQLLPHIENVKRREKLSKMLDQFSSKMPAEWTSYFDALNQTVIQDEKQIPCG